MIPIQVFDNIIPGGYQDAIEEDLMRWQFPWNYVTDVTNMSYGNNSGMAHLAYNIGQGPSEWFSFIKPIIYSIEQATGDKMLELLRIRVGFLTPSVVEDEYNTPHLDFTIPHKTVCYYVNASDGDTVVFDQTVVDMKVDTVTELSIREYVDKTEFTVAGRCSPKKGSICVFDGYRFHASSKPKHNDRRLVITINYVS